MTILIEQKYVHDGCTIPESSHSLHNWLFEGIEGKYRLVSVLTEPMQYLTGRSSWPLPFALQCPGRPLVLAVGFFCPLFFPQLYSGG